MCAATHIPFPEACLTPGQEIPCDQIINARLESTSLVCLSFGLVVRTFELGAPA